MYKGPKMILKQENDTLVLLDVVTANEEEFIELNHGTFSVLELPYSISGYYKFDPEYPEDITRIQTDGVKDLEVLRKQKLEEIFNKFDDLMTEGSFETSLGFWTDNRRGNGKDDKDNVNSLIDLGNEPVYFRDKDGEFHSLTLDDLRTLKQEMIQDGLGKYQWKWDKEAAVVDAETVQDLREILI